MRVYHFNGADHGLENLRTRRLKVATLNEINDPFELFGVNLGDPSLRNAVQAMKRTLAQKYGLLCFSQDWHNPVLWSHYADKHKGLCLAFDVPDEIVGPVSYSRSRLVVDAERFRSADQFDLDLAMRFLFTKYSHWRYEKEVRGFVTLEDKETDSGLYFTNFGENLRLVGVTVGAQSCITRKELGEALGDLQNSVEVFKTRLAFRTFRVVRQRNDKLWV